MVRRPIRADGFCCQISEKVMELRRIGDVLLRSRASPLLPFLAPAIHSATWLSSSGHVQLLAAHARASSCPRRFVSSTSSSQASSPAAALRPQEDEDDPPLRPSDGAPNPSSQPSSSTDRLSIVDDILDQTLNNRTPVTAHSRTSRFKSTSAQADNTRGSSATDVKDAFAHFPPSRDRGKGSPLFGASKTTAPRYGFSPQNLSLDVSSSLVKRLVPLAPRTIRLNSSVGRSVEVDPARGITLAAGLAKLEIIVGVNGVRRDFSKQRFYERPGLKRKRLKSERWRRRFKDGFRAIVDKVETMRRQGW